MPRHRRKPRQDEAHEPPVVAVAPPPRGRRLAAAGRRREFLAETDHRDGMRRETLPDRSSKPSTSQLIEVEAVRQTVADAVRTIPGGIAPDGITAGTF